MSRRPYARPPCDGDPDPPARTHHNCGTPVGALRWAMCPVCGCPSGRYDATRVKVAHRAARLTPDGDVQDVCSFPWPHETCVRFPVRDASDVRPRVLLQLTTPDIVRHVADGLVRLESDACSRHFASYTVGWMRDNPGSVPR